MDRPTFDRNTPLHDILKYNPGLISVLDDWSLHLVPSTVVAVTSSLAKAAQYHAIFDVDKLLAELNKKKDVDFHAEHPEPDPQAAAEDELDPSLPAYKRNGKQKPQHRRVWE
jgi:hypothetical protein